MKRIFTIAALILLLSGTVIGYYLYNKPHISVKDEKVDFIVAVDSLAREFQLNPQKANLKYADKIVLVSGKFDSQSISQNHLTTIVMKGTENLANCEMDSLYLTDPRVIHANDKIKIKGLFVGYDDLLGELQLKKCLLILK